MQQLRLMTMHIPEAFICLQESLHNQVVDILQGLNDDSVSNDRSAEWEFMGVGRDDGKLAGEFCPILYRPAVWTVIESRVMWLSETVERPGLAWDAGCIRVLTVGVFEHRQSGRRVVAMNTHLDHKGEKAKVEGAKLILREVLATYRSAKLPVFLSGDFNSCETEDPYKILTSHDSPIQDVRSLIREDKRYGFKETFTGFVPAPWTRCLIDFLFVNKAVPWKVLTYAVLENEIDGVVLSDHRPVVADVVSRTTQ